MQVTLVHIGSRGGAKDGYESLVGGYLARCSGAMRSASEVFRSEDAFLAWIDRQRGRTGIALMLLDARGKTMPSESLAEWLGQERDKGTQHVVFAVGPADGWSEAARTEGKRRGSLLSLGPMTLAHQLARLVMAEQIYRASTILTGHPYHRGEKAKTEALPRSEPVASAKEVPRAGLRGVLLKKE